MIDELEQFRRNAARHIDAFNNPAPQRRASLPSAPVKGLTVKLAVRRKRLAPDEVFVHESDSISRLQARLEAERAAVDAGYPIVGYVVDYQV